MKITVVGGSIGGLTAACLLRDSGHQVSIYERSPVPLEQRGAGIGFLPATYRYLESRAGVDLHDVAVETGHIRYLDHVGNVIYDEPHRYLFSSWNAVYASTLRHFGHDEYHLGSEMVDFSQTSSSVSVRTKDGQLIESDLLVAADGIGSVARARLAPGSTAEYAGYVAWRGMVPEAEIEGDALQRLSDAITYFVYPGSHILVYPIPGHEGAVGVGERLINFVWYCNYAPGDEFRSLMTDKDGTVRDVSIPPGFVSESNVKLMNEMARKNLPPLIRDIVLAVHNPFVQVIYDIDLDRMAFGRVCLVGDAGIVARPHAAAGTAKAAADGWALDAALREYESLDVALNAWETQQLSLAKRLLDRTRRIGARSQFLNSWDPRDPEVIFGLYEPGN